MTENRPVWGSVFAGRPKQAAEVNQVRARIVNWLNPAFLEPRIASSILAASITRRSRSNSIGPDWQSPIPALLVCAAAKNIRRDGNLFLHAPVVADDEYAVAAIDQLPADFNVTRGLGRFVMH